MGDVSRMIVWAGLVLLFSSSSFHCELLERGHGSRTTSGVIVLAIGVRVALLLDSSYIFYGNFSGRFLVFFKYISSPTWGLEGNG